MKTFQKNSNVGRIFTPKNWAQWVIKKYNILDKWTQGARIIDPTCGQGVFFHALLELSRKNGIRVSNSSLSNLVGVEINQGDKIHFLKEVKRKFAIDFPEENFITADYLDLNSQLKFDIAVGNPPWINFTELDNKLKIKLRPKFEKYGLVRNKKDALLGSSRVDLAALVIQKCMNDDITAGGYGYFFIPLSLLFNEGANKFFRPKSNETCVFSVQDIFDFENSVVFSNVSTRNGFIAIKKGVNQTFPIKLIKILKSGEFQHKYCIPTTDEESWLQTKTNSTFEFPKISVRPDQKPRQGVNSCGLNRIFIFSRLNSYNNKSSVGLFENGLGKQYKLNSKYMLPLLNNKHFDFENRKSDKYILCLHNSSGSPLNYSEIKDLEGIEDYLKKFKPQMMARKGILIQSHIKRGTFWALLGVGSYSFSPYKVAWTALGKSSFLAKVVSGHLQGNQSIHAFIPSDTLEDAQRICNELNSKIPEYLQMFAMEGTCNWAQPGRIKRILNFDYGMEQQKLF